MFGPLSKLVDETDSKSVAATPRPGSSPGRATSSVLTSDSVDPLGRSSMKVLLVEDDDGVREGLTDVLSEHGRVDAVSDPEGAIHALESGSYDVVFADMKLGSDRTAGRRIVALATRLQVPTVIVSGSTREEIAETLGDYQPRAVLTKPFQIDDVDRLMKTLFPRLSATP